MTAFYNAFEMSPKSVLLQTGTSRVRLEKRHSHSAQNCCEHLYDIFEICKNMEPGFQISHIPDPRNVFLGLGTFWHVQEFTNLFTNLQFFYKLPLIRDKS